MKKLLLFAAAIAFASAMNAEKCDFTTLTASTTWSVRNATLNSGSSTEKKLVYDVKAETEAVVSPARWDNIEFSYENSSDKEKAFTIALGDYFEFAGKNGVLTIYDVRVGSRIKLYVAGKSDKGDSSFEDPAEEPRFPEGAVAVSSSVALPKKTSDGYQWVEVEYEATSSEVVIKEFAYGYRIQWIEVEFNDDATSVHNVATAKAYKVVENGQLIIIKNGVRYNALGAKL